MYHSPELQVANLRSTVSDVESDCGGLSSSGLEPVGGNLSVSSSPSGFSGFDQVRVIPGNSSTSHPGLAQQTMVWQTKTSLSYVHSFHRSSPLAGGWRYELLRAALVDGEFSSLDFLGITYGSSVSKEVQAYLLSHLRESSSNQYGSAWRKFKSFISSNKGCRIDFNTVAKFLIFLFEREKSLGLGLLDPI